MTTKPMPLPGRVMYTCQGYADAPDVRFYDKPNKCEGWFANNDPYRILTDAELLAYVEQRERAAIEVVLAGQVDSGWLGKDFREEVLTAGRRAFEQWKESQK